MQKGRLLKYYMYALIEHWWDLMMQFAAISIFNVASVS
jgi:hypothetical protein